MIGNHIFFGCEKLMCKFGPLHNALLNHNCYPKKIRFKNILIPSQDEFQKLFNTVSNRAFMRKKIYIGRVFKIIKAELSI